MTLRDRLNSLDGKSYGAYKSLKGTHRVGELSVSIDRVQSDPFAPPSQLSVRMPFPLPVTSPVSAADLLTRRVHDRFRQVPGGKREGQLLIDAPTQHVLERTSVSFPAEGEVLLRIEAALPANGRRIRGRAAAQLLTRTLPQALSAALDVSAEELAHAADLLADQAYLREQLASNQLVAFIADGSVLPRRSGDSDVPLRDAVAFESPQSLRTSFDLPSGRQVSGMAIPEGITVIAGGGFHGKSTLLSALREGVYNHVAGDGRELAITRPDAVAVRAEDGRAVNRVDISPFITNLPTNADTTRFSTSNASGSTSQAAWVMEAIEAGTSCLLIDEDTSATNFMIRDERMRRLVPDEREPITPLLHRVTGLREAGVSTVLVTGGTSAFLDVADTVILMDAYQPRDCTQQARALAQTPPPHRGFAKPQPRSIRISTSGKKPPQAKGLHAIRIGHDSLDLSGLAQLVSPSQTRAIAHLLPKVEERLRAHEPLAQACSTALESWDSGRSGRLAKPRLQELMFAVNHLRA
ncbi:ABC-ATPase domain-containing protein [Corynebacterium tapiri]|uniref:ATPase of the ABC class n=1 Tax=Corynebacterium tapiri TaxID=1448266 RepID=A0A5C4U2D0_9CORY|nr:ABC-ATPase domain-containing protein [Corynebacterium tapiri]TNL95074.1 ATPase of the ABC class [Corynebacterium tapiri]